MAASTPADPLRCRYCNQTYQSYCKFLKHFQEKSVDFTADCETCKTSCINKCDYSLHASKHGQEAPTASDVNNESKEEIEFVSESSTYEDEEGSTRSSIIAPIVPASSSADNGKHEKSAQKSQLLCVKTKKKKSKTSKGPTTVVLDDDEFEMIETLHDANSERTKCPICRTTFKDNRNLRFHARSHGLSYHVYSTQTRANSAD